MKQHKNEEAFPDHLEGFLRNTENCLITGLAIKCLKDLFREHIKDLYDDEKLDNTKGSKVARKIFDMSLTLVKEEVKDEEKLCYLMHVYELIKKVNINFGVILVNENIKEVEKENPLEAEYMKQQLKELKS